MPARILLVDDSPIARRSIRTLLHSFEICGEAHDGKEGIEKVTELKPDIVLLDINMPVMDGLKAAEEIHRIAPATKIVFLTLYDTPATRERARKSGDSFVPKSSAAAELIPLLERLSAAPPPDLLTKPVQPNAR